MLYCARVAACADYRAGQKAGFTIDLARLVLFDRESERRIY